MNSRERVLAAVNHQKPDRVPIDLGAIRASGINAVVYDQLKRRLGVGGPTKIHDTMQILAEVELEVLERIHADVVPLDAGDAAWSGQPAVNGISRRLFCGLDVIFPPDARITLEADGSWALRDAEDEIYAHMPANGFYFDFNRPTMGDIQIDPDSFRPSATVPDERLEAMARRGKVLYEETDKAILGWGACLSVLGMSALLAENITQGSLDGWLTMLLTEKQTAHEMMDRWVDAVIAQIGLFHEAVGDYCFGWGVGSDDAGTQRGELISPELFAEMIKPHYQRLCNWVHTNTDWKTCLHSCGSIYNYIPEWIDAGIDILNPVQISAANMEPERLMSQFGGQIVFWGGGWDTQQILPHGTPDEVAAHVRHNLEIFGSGDGGYVFTQVHNIQQDVPVENVEAMLDAAHRFG